MSTKTCNWFASPSLAITAVGMAIPIKTTQFPSGEYIARIYEPIPNTENIIIVKSMSPPTNDSLMEILNIIDAAKNSGARNITLVAPYLGYSRQNSMETPFSSIGMRIVAQMLETIGIKRLVTVDIHSLESLDFFSIDVTHISIIDILDHYGGILNLADYIIVAPDKGSSERLKGLGKDIVTMVKHRTDDGIKMELAGDVEGRRCLIIDDIYDSGRTMEAAALCLRENKAAFVAGYCTHFLSEVAPSIPLYVTDTVPLIPNENFFANILPIAPVINKFL